MVKEVVHYIIVRENSHGEEMADTGSDCERNGYSPCRSDDEGDGIDEIETDSYPQPAKDKIKVMSGDDKEVVVSLNGKKFPINLGSKSIDMDNFSRKHSFDRCESTNSNNFSRKSSFIRCESTNLDNYSRKPSFNRCESTNSDNSSKNICINRCESTTSDKFSRKSSVISTQSTCGTTCCQPKVPKISSPSGLVNQFAKLTFLKILLVDMGISAGDCVTDFLQGINLIWDFSAGNFREATFYYGIAVLLTSWLPSIYCLFHLWFSEELNKLVKNRAWISFLPFMLMFIVFFPIMPTLFYLHLLCQRQETPRERAKYRQLESRAHEIKSIAGAIEAPIQVIILFWLMLRGILTMPWNEPLSTTCVEDNLGRIVCFPSIPMASIFFSTLSIMKSMFNLNISPLLITQSSCLESIKNSVQLFLRFTPFLLSNVIFRVSTFAFLFVYLDFWAAIPCGVLFCFNLVYFGVSFTKFGNKNIDLEPKQTNYELQRRSQGNNGVVPTLQRLSTRDYAVPRGIADSSAYIDAFSKQFIQAPKHQAVAIYDTPYEDSPFLNSTPKKPLSDYFSNRQNTVHQEETPKRSLPPPPVPSHDTISSKQHIPMPGKVRRSLPFNDTSSQDKPSRPAPFPPPPRKVESINNSFEDNSLDRKLPPPPRTVESADTSFEDNSLDITLPPHPTKDESVDTSFEDNPLDTPPPPFPPPTRSAPFRPPLKSTTFTPPSHSPPFPPPKRSSTFPSTMIPEDLSKSHSIQIPRKSPPLPPRPGAVNPQQIINMPRPRMQSISERPRMSSISESPALTPAASPFKNLNNEYNSTPNASPIKNKPIGWLTPNASPVKNKAIGYSNPTDTPVKSGWNKNIAIVAPFNETQSTILSEESDYDIVVDNDAYFDEIVTMENPEIPIPPYKPSRFVRMLSTVSNKSITPSYINEENTSIFFNSISGMFFPSCHTHLPRSVIVNEQLQNLLRWQRRIFQTQVVYFNIICLIAIIVVAILVTAIDSYNYAPTTLNPFWFMMGSFFLAMMMMLSTALAMEPDSVEMVSRMCTSSKERYSEPKSNSDVPVHNPINVSVSVDASNTEIELMTTQETDLDEMDSFFMKRKENMEETCQSMEDTISISSDRIKKRFLCMHIVYCFLITFIVLIPAILGLLVFKYKEDPNPYIYLIEENGSRASVYDMTILTAFPITNFEYNKTEIIAGSIDNDCFFDTTKSYSDKIIVINQTSPKCSVLSQDEDFLTKVYNSSAKAVILLDNTPRFRWRLSSPYSIHNLFFGAISSFPKSSNTPILMLRQSDWGKFNNYLDKAGNKLFIVFGESNSLDLADILPCTNSKTVKVETAETDKVGKPKKKETCSEGKHLYGNGTVSEQVCVESECWTLGQRCPQSYFENIRKFEVTTSCDKKSLDGKSLNFISSNSGKVLEPSLLEIASGDSDKYCCKDNGDKTSTFVEVLGGECGLSKSRDVVRFMETCKFTEYLRGQCVKGEIEVARYCRVPHHSCVVKEYYKTYCFNNKPLSHCEMQGTLSCN